MINLYSFNLFDQIYKKKEECFNDEQVVQQLDNTTLILFARTDREKEEWFKLFKKSSAKNLTGLYTEIYFVLIKLKFLFLNQDNKSS